MRLVWSKPVSPTAIMNSAAKSANGPAPRPGFEPVLVRYTRANPCMQSRGRSAGRPALLLETLLASRADSANTRKVARTVTISLISSAVRVRTDDPSFSMGTATAFIRSRFFLANHARYNSSPTSSRIALRAKPQATRNALESWRNRLIRSAVGIVFCFMTSPQKYSWAQFVRSCHDLTGSKEADVGRRLCPFCSFFRRLLLCLLNAASFAAMGASASFLLTIGIGSKRLITEPSRGAHQEPRRLTVAG